MKGVEAVAKILQQEGVEVLFSYPNNNLIEAAAAIGIRPIIARTEKTLLNMTDGYSRATNGRKLGVCVVQSGAGIENAFSGITQAFADSIPILVMPGGPDQRTHHGSGEFDPLPPFQHITKWQARINYVERVPHLMRRAFAQLRGGKLGPVLLELPRDISVAELGDTLDYVVARGTRAAADPGRVSEVVDRLLAADRPVIHAGHGVHWADAYDELRELAELLELPVMTTMAGKSAFPEDHPLSLGTGALTIARAAAEALLESDLIVGVGCSFAKGSFSAPLPPNKSIVHITSDAGDIDKSYLTELPVIGDAKLVLRQIIDEVLRRGVPRTPISRLGLRDQIAAARKAELDEWLPRWTSVEAPINPYRVLWDLNNTVDKQRTIVTHDSGNPRDQMLTTYQALQPRGYLGWGKSTQLGTGLGLALGAKLARPDQLVVNVMGDLAFGTAAMEVETAVRERIPIMTVLLNNSLLGGYSHYMPVASERYGANRLSGQYSEVAKGLGAYTERVTAAADVVPALKRGIAATEKGQAVVLEFITKEEPTFPRTGALYETLQRTTVAR